MEETKIPEVDVRPLRPVNDPTLVTAFGAGADAVERAVVTSFELVETMRRETVHAAFAAAELVEGAQQSATKVVREALAKLDKVTEQLAGGAQATALAVTADVRGAGERAVDLVARTTETLISGRSRSSAA